MYAWELILQSLRDMRAHKVRSLLALFGIVWGTIAVVLLLALGEGFYQSNKKSLMQMADATLIVSFGATTRPYQGLDIGRSIQMPTEAILHWSEIIPQIHKISPILRAHKLMSQDSRVSTNQVIGVADSFSQLRKLEIASGGRFLNQVDISHRRQVVFLGHKLKLRLFGTANPIGKSIRIGNIPFTVIGVQEATNIHHGRLINEADSAFIPYTVYLSLWGDTYQAMALIATDNDQQVKNVKASLLHYLSRQYRFDSHDQSAVRIFEFAKAKEFFDKFFLGIELFLGFCGLMTLIVGGIGVANILFLIITERTPEIGLRMALGARTQDILLQFMLEAGLIVALGGMLGLSLSWLTIHILQLLPLPEWIGQPVLVPSILLGTVSLLAMIALLAGYFPARRAAAMQPVDALAF